MKFTRRNRLEKRIDRTTGNVGGRARQMVQLNHPMGFTHNDLGDHVGADLGCLGQHIVKKRGPGPFTHYVQFNLRFAF